MATNTSILGLSKPAYTDDADVAVINSNSDLIDAEAGRTRANFAAEYSNSSAYAVGAFCTHAGILYQCNTAIGSGGEAWTAAHWTQISAGDAITASNQAIAGQTSSDANTVTVGIVQRFLYNQNTLHTPYKQGITNFTAGWIESYCASANYGFQTAYSTGDAEYMRVLNGGTWGDWRVVSGKRTSYTITSTDPDVTVNDSTKMYFVKTGSIVAVSMSIKITNAQTGFEHRKSVTMNLPPNCMPPTANNFVIDNGDVLGFTKVSLNVNGVLTIYPQTSGTTYALGVIVYATDN